MKNTILIVLFLHQSSGLAQNMMRIPEGKSILIDGKLSSMEWSDALKIKIPDTANLYLKHNSEYFLVAVEVSEDRNAVVDIYYSKGSQLLNLHASAKLGQRVLKDGKWVAWSWWNNQGWSANVSRVESFDTLTFLNENVREFQIHKSLLEYKSTRLFFEITMMGSKKGRMSNGNSAIEIIAIPRGMTSTSQDGWLKVVFN